MADGRYVAGVDLGGTYIKFALLDSQGQVAVRDSVPTRAADGAEMVLERISAGVRRLAATVGDSAIEAVGVGIPGLVAMETGVTIDLANFPGRWPGVQVASTLGVATGFPIYVINDARAFAVAEHGMGAAQEADVALCVTIGTGIGGGLVVHGQPVFGLGGAAGEIGHLIVREQGPRCSCGNRGCVEMLASGPAIVGETVRRIAQGFTTDLRRRAGDDLRAVTPEMVTLAAAEGDSVAADVLQEAGYHLGIALAGAIALLAPRVIVIGGGVAQPGGIYWRSAEATARSHSFVTDISQIEFRPAMLGYDAGVIGAALWGRARHAQIAEDTARRSAAPASPA
ncbi:MAG: ROK family protein [Chloroflexia bacterium]|nr:ROK family protein [Chloroflexia bacterium]